MEVTIMFYISIVVSFLCILTKVKAQCQINDFPVQQSFDIDKYLGKWYEIAWRSPANIPPSLRFVDYKTILSRGKNSNVSMILKYRVGSSKSKCQTSRGTLYLNGQEPAKLKFLDPVINGAATISDYWVVSTDYKSYSVVYSCGKLLQNGTCDPNTIDAAIWSRKKSAWSLIFNPKVNDVIKDICLPSDTFLVTKQSNECVTSEATALYIRYTYVISAASGIFVMKYFLL